MAFFAVERRAGEDVLRLPVPTTYPSRDAVVQALGELLASGAIPAGSDLYVVDLEAAVPVLVIPGAALPGEALDVPAAVAPVAPIVEEVTGEEIGALDASEAADVYAAWPEAAGLPSGDEEAEAPDGQEQEAPVIDWQGALQDALKRAASSLESEGIVPPVPVEAERPHAQIAEPMGVATDAGAAAGESSDEAAWPWAHVDAVAVEDVVGDTDDEDEPAASAPAESADENGEDDQTEGIPSVDEILAEIDEDEPAALTYREPGADLPAYEQPERVDSVLIHTAPAEGEDAFLPSPVILGDYGDRDGDGSEAEVAAEVAALIGAGGEDEDGLEYVAPGETHVAEALEEESGADTIQPGDEREEEPLEEAPAQDAQVEGYAGDGGLDMSEYTCNDCVYANTCPKVGQVTPAECVSFQWKSA
jgi:hypothetical protein